MRTDTISRNDTQDSEITILRQQMASANVSASNANRSISEIKKSLKEMVRTGDENFEYCDVSIRALTDNQKELNDLINKTNQRLDRQSYALSLLYGMFAGLLLFAFIYFIV